MTDTQNWSLDAAIRRLEMLEALHERGLQLLRGTPAMAPSGVFWRLTVSVEECQDVDRFSTADRDEGLSGEELADRFAVEHPVLVAAGRGADPAYAAWWSSAVEIARRGWLPYFYADWPTDDIDGVPLTGPDEGRPVLPWPPAR